MKKLLLALIILSTLLSITVQAQQTERQIPISQIEILQGAIGVSNLPEYTYIGTIDGNGWAIDYNETFAIGDNVMIIFDNMGTADIYDDEIIQIVKIK